MTTPAYQLIRIEHLDGVPVIIILSPELRSDTLIARLEQELNDAIEKTGAHQLVLDLTGVHFISSSGLRALIVLRKRLRELGGQFKMCGVHPYVEDVFKTTRLFTKPFDILEDASSAAAALKASGSAQTA